MTRGPRGALGQIWRVDVGPTSFALKEIFANPPDVAAELAFTRLADGVRLPASYPAHDGRFFIETPAGTWLRLYEWIDVRPVDPVLPEAVGMLFARLHRCAPATSDAEHSWYHEVSDATGWDGWIAPPDPASLVLCHRDLHPENLLADATGELVVLDWDNFGPADPSREIACGLFDWFHDGEPDFDAMARMYSAYIAEGGPGRIESPRDFTMLIAIRLNFIEVQRAIALDLSAKPTDREWASREVADTTRRLPTPAQLATALELLHSR